MTRERDLLARILRDHGARPDLRLFRNNTGQAWTGDAHRISHAATVRLNPGDVVIRQARPLHAGLCTGSSDLIGWRRVETDLGAIAQFVACEVKTGRQQPTKQQQAFLAAVQTFGGLAVVARDPEDLERALRASNGG